MYNKKRLEIRKLMVDGVIFSFFLRYAEGSTPNCSLNALENLLLFLYPIMFATFEIV